MSGFQGDSSFISSGYVAVSSGWVRDPQSGVRFEQRYEGTAAGIGALALTLVSQGASVRYDDTGPGKKTLVASWGRDPNEPESAEVPTDRWELELAPYQIAIWRHPDVVRESLGLSGGQSFDNGPSGYRRKLLDAVAEGGQCPFTTPVALQVFDLLTKGTEYWETQRPIIRRQRTYTPSYTDRAILTPTSLVYSRSSLISTFSPPAIFQGQIPVDPTEETPTRTQWGWRLTQRSCAYTGSLGKFEESTSWEGAYWETALYTFL